MRMQLGLRVGTLGHQLAHVEAVGVYPQHATATHMDDTPEPATATHMDDTPEPAHGLLIQPLLL